MKQPKSIVAFLACEIKTRHHHIKAGKEEIEINGIVIVTSLH